MSDQPAAPSPAPPTLSERLQQVAEVLTSGQTPDSVIQLIVPPAMQALGAVAGAVLLVGDSAGEGGWELQVASADGAGHAWQTLWQGAALGPQGPAGDVLRRRTPLYVEGPGELSAAYPDLDHQAGGAALLPMVLDGQPLGVIVLGLGGPHTFAPDERRFLETLAAQAATGLGRARATEQLRLQIREQQGRADALSAFIALTEVAGASTDLRQLARHAAEVLQASIPDLVSAYYELQGARWVAQIITEAMPADLRAAIQAGLPMDTPAFGRAVAAAAPVFIDGWDAAGQRIPNSEQYHAAAFAPYFRGGQPFAMFVVGFESADSWTDQQREVFRAVARSLGGALERAEQVRQQERQAALEAFVALTEAIGTETDQARLAERAAGLIQSFLPGWSVGYYEPEGGLWQARVTAAIATPELEAMLRAGLPLETPGYTAAVRAAGPVFIDRRDAGAQRFLHTGTYGCAAFYPYFRQGQPAGMFVVGSQRAQFWQEADKAVFTAVGRSLGLALDWAGQAGRLQAQNTELEAQRQSLDAFVDFTEAVGTETDVLALARQAMALLSLHFTDCTGCYYVLDDDLWKLRVHTDDLLADPKLLRQAQAGWPVDTPLFARSQRGRAVTFVDGWDPAHQQVEGSESYGTAAYPLEQGGQVQATLVVGLKSQIRWTERDRAVFRALGRGLSLALERSEQARRLEEERAALAAFAAFTESVGTNTDLAGLIQHAERVLRTVFEDVSVAYHELDQGRWTLRAWSDDVDPALAQLLVAGLPEDTPAFAKAVRQQAPHFIDGWDAAREGVEHSGGYGTSAVYPLKVGGHIRRTLNAARRHARAWTERDKAVFRSVGRSLQLAFERLEQTAQLEAQNAELAARTHALEAFAQLTGDLSVQQDPQALVRRAQEVALSLLAPGYALYYEPDNGRWHNRVQVGEVGNAELQAFIDAGPMVGQTPSVDRPWTTRQALYQDVYAQGSDTPAEMVQHVGAAASLPVLLRGEPVGVFIAVLFGQRAWTRADRAALDTVVRSLEIALSRAEQARRFEEERAALAAFASFTEAVGTQTDVPVLSQQAVEVVGRSLDVNAAYFERAGEVFGLQSWSSGCAPAFLARAKPGHTLADPSFARAARERQVVFVDGQGPDPAAGAAAFQPFFQDGQLTGMLLMETPRAQRWSERDRAIFLAAGRGLALALERTELARLAIKQRDTLDGRTRALEAANEELEAFAYSVSHDLRTPVRHIAGFNDLLRKRLGDHTDEQVGRYLSVVDQAATRMNTLLDAVLDLSRTSRAPLRLGTLEVRALVDSVRLELEPDARDRPVEWRVGPLPRLVADPDILRQALVNLLSNALKYTRTRDPAVIEVWAEEREGDWAIFVRDNGVGFDQKYQDKLFGVFQRLHRADEFEGVGVGLANVRRAVLRHGGTVFAQGELGQWATFGFTLPKTLEEDLTRLAH